MLVVPIFTLPALSVFYAYLKTDQSSSAKTDVEFSVMQSPVVPDPFKNERKLRKYEDGETLLVRRKKAKLEIKPIDWEPRAKPTLIVDPLATVVIITPTPSIMSPSSAP